jgi:hypothetical protein
MLVLECAALGSAALLLCLCAARLSGADPFTPQAFGAALVGGAFAAATWFCERRKGPLEIARRLDRGLEQRGALLTAFECDRRAGPEASERFSLERLLVERVARELPARAHVRAIARPSPALAASVLLAAALLAWTLERGGATVGSARPLADLSALQRVLRAGLVASGASGASGAEGSASAPSGEPLALLARAADRLDEVTREERGGELRSSLREIDAELGRLLGEPGAHRPEWSAARDLTEAALAALSSDGAGGDRGVGSSGGSTGSGADTALANAPPERTMAGSAPAAEPLPNASGSTVPSSAPAAGAGAPSGPAAETGTLAGRWWPARYDALVASWTLDRSGAKPGEH